MTPVKTSEKQWLRKRRKDVADLSGGVAKRGRFETLQTATSIGEESWCPKSQKELDHQNALELYNKGVAHRENALLPCEATAGVVAVAELIEKNNKKNDKAYNLKLARNARLADDAATIDLAKTKVYISRHVCLAPATRRMVTRVVDSMTQAEMCVVTDITQVTYHLSIVVGLLGAKLALPNVIATGGRGVYLGFRPAIAIKRKFWMSTAFIKDRPKIAQSIYEVLCRPFCKWTPLASSDGYIEAAKKARGNYDAVGLVNEAEKAALVPRNKTE